MQDSAVASVSPRARQSASTCSSIVRSSLANSQRSSDPASDASSASASPSAPGSTTRSTWISKSRAQIVASTPSGSPTGLLQRARDSGLAHAEEPKHPTSGRPGTRKQLQHRLGLDRRGPEPLQLAGRPGQDYDDRPAVLEHEAGRGAREADRRGAVRHRCLFPYPRLEVRVGPPQPLGDASRNPFDLPVKIVVYP